MSITLNADVPLFENLMKQTGKADAVLEHTVECMALFYYAQKAAEAYKNETTGIQYEGNPDNTYDYRQLYLTVAYLYGANPETMLNYWPIVAKQCRIKGYSIPPDELKYRFILGTELLL